MFICDECGGIGSHLSRCSKRVAGARVPTTRDPLALVRETADAAEVALLSHADAVARRDDAIRAALAAGVRAVDIAEAAKLTTHRVYQIRDGRR